MKNSDLLKTSVALHLLLATSLYSVDVLAAIDSAGVLDNVLQRYSASASQWGSIMVKHATFLFWSLVMMSMVWTFGFMLMRKADIGEFFAEFIRFTIFTGFFWWLLINGAAFATSIIQSLRQIGGDATGLGNSLSPSSIVDIGFEIFYRVLDQSSVWSPVDSLCGIILSVAVLVILALIGANMLVLLCSGWVLAYGGVFLLGFGGARWTSDIAINYYKSVLGVAVSLMVMVLLVGIGKSILDQYYAQMSQGISLKEMGVILIVAIVLFYLVDKVPAMVSGIVGSASSGAVGAFGAGAVTGAAGMAAAAVATGGSSLVAGAAEIGGGASALKAAFTSAQANMSNATGMFAGRSNDDSGGMSQRSSGHQASSFAQAMNTGVSFAADMSANLVKGIGSATQDKTGSILEDFKERLAETAGGKAATAIRSNDNASQGSNKEQPNEFSGDSLAGGGMSDEVAVFVNKPPSNSQTRGDA